MDITSPQSMMTGLLGETRLALIDLLEKSQISLHDVCLQPSPTSTGAVPGVDRLDLLDILNYLICEWSTVKEKLFYCDKTNGFGATYRSYIGLLKTARNEWAHRYTYSYEDVLHNCFIAQRFFRDTMAQVDISIIEQIAEASMAKMSTKRDIPVSSQSDQDEEVSLVSEEGAKEEEVPITIPGTIVSVVQTQEDDEGEEEDNEIAVEFEVDDIEEDEEEPEELGDEDEELSMEEIEDLDDKDDETDIDKEFKDEIIQLSKIVETRQYQKLRRMIGFKKQPNVEEGKYPGTLYITAEGPIWGSWGPEKLRLIEDDLLWVALFAVHGVTPKDMRGNWKGDDMICLPYADHSQVQFGRNKARMLCAAMEEISEWLAQN